MPRINGWIILKWTFKKLYGRGRSGLVWLKIGKGLGLF
jgi:hypothetical protein